MATLPPDASVAEIEDEMVFTQLLIDTLDPDTDNYDARRAELDGTVADLETRLVAALGAGEQEQQQDSGRSSDAHSSAYSFGGQDSETSFTAAAESNGFLQQSRKRPRQDSTLSAVELSGGVGAGGGAGPETSKFRRTNAIPGAYPTAAGFDDASTGTAPDSWAHRRRPSSGHGLGVSPGRALQRQREAERAAAERARQQQRDAQIARSLQNGGAVANADWAAILPSLHRPAAAQVMGQGQGLGQGQGQGQPAYGVGGSGFGGGERDLASPFGGMVPGYVSPWPGTTLNGMEGTNPGGKVANGESSSRAVNGAPWVPTDTHPRASDANTDDDDDDSFLEEALREIDRDTFLQSTLSNPHSSQLSRSRPTPSQRNGLTPQIKPENADAAERMRQHALWLQAFPNGVPIPTRPHPDGGAGLSHVLPNASLLAPQYASATASAYPGYDGTPAIGGYTDGFDGLNHLVNGAGPYGAGTAQAPLGFADDLMMGSSFIVPYPDNTDASMPPMPGWPRVPAVDRGYDYLYSDPTKTKEEINKLLENIRPDEELPPEMREGTPDALKYPLMEHQKLGLSWLKSMETGSNKGGILADDMGLGKTIQALALIVARPSDDPRRKTTLIIAPVSLMRQWEREIKDKIKSGRRALSVYVQHGATKKKAFKMLREYDVVLTTFGTLASELKRKLQWEQIKTNNPDAVPDARHTLALLGDDCKWYRIIIDEAQCIKNKKTATAQAACHLQSLSRFCMTGTPMMNNVGELYSLIHFLRIRPYNEWEKFNRDFNLPFKSHREYSKDAAMKKLQALLKAILLRRTKQSKIDGEPILRLPPRTTEKQHAVFSDDENDFYRALENRTRLQFNRYLKAGTVGRNYSNILVLLLRLRQACCHPHLIKDFGVATAANLSGDDMTELAKKLSDDVVARIKEANGSFECPVCYDAVENPAIFFPCGHDTCSECFARITDPSRALAEGIVDVTGVKCPECRAQVDSKNVIDYNAFKQVHMPELLDQDDAAARAAAEAEAEADTDTDTDDDESDDADDDDDETESLNGFIVDDEADGEPDPGRKPPSSKTSKSSKKTKPARKDRKGKGRATDKKPKTLAELKREGMKSAAGKRRYLRRLRRDWETSAKIEKTLEILRGIIDNDRTEKTIIFSQFTSLLDLLEVPIDREGWNYRRYDGSMSSNLRNDAVMDFVGRPSCRIMLVSLKAGNAGLNLNAASQVIILDPFWNPYIEEQAIDRAHRIGQLRPVQVHRILVEGTVEDRILALQDSKREIISTALDESAGKSVSRLGMNELAYLFGITNDPRQNPSNSAA